MLRNLVLTIPVLTGLLCFGINAQAYAAIPPPGPQSGTVGVEGTIPSDPPTQAATIVQPAAGQSISTIPVTVSGTCPNSTIVKIFSNNIFIGSALCTNGSYTIRVSLFSGRNDLVAQVFDALDQQGPDSRVVTVNYTDAQYAQFGSHVLITSQFARRAADPGAVLEWPVIVSGGLGPYALSIDWGDGSGPELHSEPFAGNLSYKHSYKTAGVYKVIFTVVDGNGTAGYLQVISVATGNTTTGGNAAGTSSNGGTNGSDANKTVVTQTKVLWQPTVALVFLAIATFWLGQKFELSAIRKRIEREYR